MTDRKVRRVAGLPGVLTPVVRALASAPDGPTSPIMLAPIEVLTPTSRKSLCARQDFLQ